MFLVARFDVSKVGYMIVIVVVGKVRMRLPQQMYSCSHDTMSYSVWAWLLLMNIKLKDKYTRRVVRTRGAALCVTLKPGAPGGGCINPLV